MITNSQTIYPDTDAEFLASIPEDTLFFDIETTGFSPASTHLYMIGCSYMQEGRWQTIQWLEDTKTAEGELLLLQTFSEFASHFGHCISFNGATFDFPYIQKKCQAHHLPDPLAHLEHTDLYRAIRPYKQLLDLPDLKQKSVESFLGIRRTDTYSGGELIKVYDAFIKSGDAKLKDLLILHNFDDICGMIKLLPLTAYINFFEGHFDVLDAAFTENTLHIHIKPSHFILIPLDIHGTLFDLSLSAHNGYITVPCYSGTLKFFYDNYKDYYYLPAEDEAIHKSIGAYVDKSCRIKATKENCYTKKSGFFLPQTSALFTPSYQETTASSISYFEQDMLDLHPDTLRAYILNLLPFCGK